MSDENADVMGTAALPVGGIYRWLPVAVVTTAVVGFVTLAWYAYHSGTQSLKEEDLLVVEADKTPMKEKPLDPGGMKFPNQDKTVFETFAGSSAVPPKVERILPPPEEPMSKNIDTSGTKTWVNDAAGRKAPFNPPKEEALVDTKKAEKTPPAVAVQPSLEKATDIKTYKAGDAPSADKVAEVAAAAVQAVNNAPAADDTKRLEPSAAGSNAKIQLGAYQSEKEAQEAWVKMQKKFSELSGKSPLVIKADLGAKGIYYRLRTGGFAGAEEVKSVCAKLAKQNQACIPVN